MTAMNYDVIIIGAGAAGLMCAFQAGLRKRRVVLLDHSDKLGKKIIISGGGRCNFTNLHVSAEHYLSQNPHFCKSALAQYPPEKFIALLESYGVKYYEKKLGQLFCSTQALDLLNVLKTECERANVEIYYSITSNICNG